MGPNQQDLAEGLLTRYLSRRNFLTRAGAGAAAAVALTGCGDSTPPVTPTPPPTPTPAVTEADVLNFALNLEYLEAEYYLRAVSGSGLSSTDAGGSAAGTVTGGSAVTFKTPAIQQYANEIAQHELAHVKFLRNALGSAAVARPVIDLTGSFNAAASAAGIGAAFNPFADENSFLIGAFVFEDVGVTAYHGAAGSLTTKSTLAAAAGILATEAYHAGTVRTLLAQIGGDVLTNANKISTLRAAAGGGMETQISGSKITAADSQSIGFSRTTDQVLHIVYLSAAAGVASKGGFYPNGMNGTIKASAS